MHNFLICLLPIQVDVPLHDIKYSYKRTQKGTIRIVYRDNSSLFQGNLQLLATEIFTLKHEQVAEMMKELFLLKGSFYKLQSDATSFTKHDVYKGPHKGNYI